MHYETSRTAPVAYLSSSRGTTHPDLAPTQEIRALDPLDQASQLSLARHISAMQDATERIDEGLRNLGIAVVVLTVAVTCGVAALAAMVWVAT